MQKWDGRTRAGPNLHRQQSGDAEGRLRGCEAPPEEGAAALLPGCIVKGHPRSRFWTHLSKFGSRRDLHTQSCQEAAAQGTSADLPLVFTASKSASANSPTPFPFPTPRRKFFDLSASLFHSVSI